MTKVVLDVLGALHCNPRRGEGLDVQMFSAVRMFSEAKRILALGGGLHPKRRDAWIGGWTQGQCSAPIHLPELLIRALSDWQYCFRHAEHINCIELRAMSHCGHF